MKGLVTAATLAMVFSAGAMAVDSSDPRDDGQTQFYVKLTGEVPKRCMMTTQSTDLKLNLDSGEASEFKFTAWCNSHSDSGLLVVGAPALKNLESDDVIPLDLEFEGETGRIDFEQNSSNGHAIETSFKISNSKDSNEGTNNTLTITPETNGFERVGKYATDMYVSLYPM